MSNFSGRPVSRYFVLTVIFLLLGAALRITSLGYLTKTLDFDEAYYAMDADSLFDEPRFVPFFDGNNGRESLWMYTLLPALSVMDGQPLALRLTSALVGILTLAALYRLARELFDVRTAAWSTGVLAVLYWHVHISHIGFRVITYPLVGTLALALLLRAYRKNRLRDWLAAGAFVGLMLYTYLAARVWFGFAGIVMAIMFVRGQNRRWGVLLAGGIAGLVSIPLLQYLVMHPVAADTRLEDVLVLSADTILQNIHLWINAFAYQGSTYYFHNEDGRPILDIPLLILFVTGISWLVIGSQRRNRVVEARLKPACAENTRLWSSGDFAWRLLFLLVLAGLSVVPSLLSAEAPHYLRAIGLIIPIALVGGVGAAWLEKRLRTMNLQYLALAIPVALIVVAGARTYSDFWSWSHDFQFPDYRQDEQNITWALVDYLKHPNADAIPDYYAHWDRAPYLGFMIHQFGLTRLDIYEFPDCTISPVMPFTYVGRQVQEPDLTARAGDVTLLKTIYGIGTGYDYAIYRVTPPMDKPVGAIGGVMGVSLASTLPDVASPGSTLTLQMHLHALAAMNRPYTMFVHVYPVDALELKAQVDAPICPDYPPARWYPGYEARVTRTFQLPDDIAPGTYRVVIGIYDSETGERLPVDGEPGGFLALHTLKVE